MELFALHSVYEKVSQVILQRASVVATQFLNRLQGIPGGGLFDTLP